MLTPTGVPGSTAVRTASKRPRPSSPWRLTSSTSGLPVSTYPSVTLLVESMARWSAGETGVFGGTTSASFWGKISCALSGVDEGSAESAISSAATAAAAGARRRRRERPVPHCSRMMAMMSAKRRPKAASSNHDLSGFAPSLA